MPSRVAVSAFITSTFGTCATSVIGVKSRIGSYGIFAYSHGLIACVATAPITIVVPSGAAFAAASAPRLPPAPGRFSTTTTPRLSLTLSASARATMSSGPPGGYGTISRIGRCCAKVGKAAARVERGERVATVHGILSIGGRRQPPCLSASDVKASA